MRLLLIRLIRGARGSPCLGHGDAPIASEEWSRRINGLFSIATPQTRVQVPFELLGWCMKWSMPRPLAAAFGTVAGAGGESSLRIVQLAAGDLSTAFRSADGRLFLCGSGPAVPNFLPPNRTNLLLASERQLRKEAEDEASVQTAQLREQLAEVVKTPRSPSDCWLRELCSQSVALISSGGGCRMFVVMEEEAIASALTAPLLERLVSAAPGAAPPSVSNGAVSDADDDAHSHRSGGAGGGATVSTLASGAESVFAHRGRCDCMILATGKAFLCHRALLAQRSPELRDRIYMESPIHITEHLSDGHGSGADDGVVQIMLPELTRDAARALIYFLYRCALE